MLELQRIVFDNGVSDPSQGTGGSNEDIWCDPEFDAFPTLRKE
ncbi:TPA: hypothetical protein ACGOWL_001381 [Streptococcus suis]